MTIRQIREPCWVLDPELPGDDERHPHYAGRADALKAIEDAKEYGYAIDARTSPRHLGACCWLVQCDGDCEQVIDEEEEGWTIHHDSRQAAEETVASWRWTYSADGRSVFCPEDQPEDAVPAPATPAELEAAGQMKLPGVA